MIFYELKVLILILFINQRSISLLEKVIFKTVKALEVS